MLFVELGREVSPLNLKHRQHKAVITGIKDNKFVVILKQDRTYEVIRLKDIVLNDKLYNLEDLKDGNNEFFNSTITEDTTTDFDRFVARLKTRIENEIVQEKLSKN